MLDSMLQTHKLFKVEESIVATLGIINQDKNQYRFGPALSMPDTGTGPVL